MANWTSGNKYIDQTIDDNDRMAIAYNYAVELCNADNVRYSQASGERGQTVNGIYYLDCSCFIDVCLEKAGFDIKQWCKDKEGYSGYPSTNMFKNMLPDLDFTEVDASGEHKEADIGVNYGKHTEMVYKGGTTDYVFMGAHSSHSNHDLDVAIDTSQQHFNHLFRFGEGITPSGNVFSFYVASAIAGNFWTESTGISPTRWESGVVRDWTSTYSNNTGGYGIGQWTNVGSSYGRLYKLYKYMTESDYSMDSGDGQVHYLPIEKAWTPLYSGHFDWRSEFPTFDDFMTSDSTDLDTLTHAFQNCWEVNTDSSTSRRQDYAKQAFDFISENWDNDDISEWVKGNRTLTTEEALNNAVLLYRNLNSIYGGNLVTQKDSNSGDYGKVQTGTTDNTEFSGNEGISTFSDFLTAMLAKNKNTKNLIVKNGLGTKGEKN